mmetsp:Transcript_93/g.160  ORF Transcript_93/g.160 Transcript_93/m.160 type:complete len:131 (+) Transcript_93:42-434(+)
MAFSSAPHDAFEKVNGVEEWLDKGDDCHESNVRERADMFGYDLWIDYGSSTELIEHRTFNEDPAWQRYAKDTNIPVYFPYRDQIWAGEISPAAKNDFNMTVWRDLDCAYKIYLNECKEDFVMPEQIAEQT